MLIQKCNPKKMINQDALLSVYDDKSSKYFLLDVRAPYEFAECHIPGSINIPIAELAKHISQIPSQKHIVTICQRGEMRSPKAENYLRQNKFTADFLEGGMDHWRGQTETN